MIQGYFMLLIMKLEMFYVYKTPSNCTVIKLTEIVVLFFFIKLCKNIFLTFFFIDVQFFEKCHLWKRTDLTQICIFASD